MIPPSVEIECYIRGGDPQQFCQATMRRLSHKVTETSSKKSTVVDRERDANFFSAPHKKCAMANIGCKYCDCLHSTGCRPSPFQEADVQSNMDSCKLPLPTPNPTILVGLDLSGERVDFYGLCRRSSDGSWFFVLGR